MVQALSIPNGKGVIVVIEEVELEVYLLGEVVNVKSQEYLQAFFFTHRCVDSSGVVWYKAHTSTDGNTYLWFKKDEVEWD